VRLRASHSVDAPSMVCTWTPNQRLLKTAGMDINKKGTEAGEKKVGLSCYDAIVPNIADDPVMLRCRICRHCS
jgi:hypothetical protein